MRCAFRPSASIIWRAICCRRCSASRGPPFRSSRCWFPAATANSSTSPASGNTELLGDTLDDAAGEAFDKTAKLLGLPYPGGPALAQLAERGTPGAVKLPRPMLASGDLDFSFSGLKTAVLTLARKAAGTATPDALPLARKADIALEFQTAIVDVLVAKALAALAATGRQRLVVAGGVGANRELRARLLRAAAERGSEVFFPDLGFCTDNGAMIALVGALRLADAPADDYAFAVRPRWELTSVNAGPAHPENRMRGA